MFQDTKQHPQKERKDHHNIEIHETGNGENGGNVI